MRPNLRRAFFAASLCVISPTIAAAFPVDVTITLHGVSGTLGAQAFTDQLLTFKTTGDTDDIEISGDYRDMKSTSAQVRIESLGTFEIINDTYVWTRPNYVGFFDDNWNDIVYGSDAEETNGVSAADYELTTEAAFAYDPITIGSSSYYSVTTTGGALVLTEAKLPGTFVSALPSAVPLPAAAPLLAAGLASLGFMRRRRG